MESRRQRSQRTPHERKHQEAVIGAAAFRNRDARTAFDTGLAPACAVHEGSAPRRPARRWKNDGRMQANQEARAKSIHRGKRIVRYRAPGGAGRGGARPRNVMRSAHESQGRLSACRQREQRDDTPEPSLAAPGGQLRALQDGLEGSPSETKTVEREAAPRSPASR